jgi:hypothetical protein
VVGLISTWMLLMAWVGMTVDLMTHDLALLTSVLF